jgi:hypothetical protein
MAVQILDTDLRSCAEVVSLRAERDAALETVTRLVGAIDEAIDALGSLRTHRAGATSLRTLPPSLTRDQGAAIRTADRALLRVRATVSMAESG